MFDRYSSALVFAVLHHFVPTRGRPDYAGTHVHGFQLDFAAFTDVRIAALKSAFN